MLLNSQDANIPILKTTLEEQILKGDLNGIAVDPTYKFQTAEGKFYIASGFK